MTPLSFLLLAALGASAGGADARPRPREWKIDSTLSLTEKDGKWVFAVTGRTDLPAETVLTARVVVPEEIVDPIYGRQEDDEESLVADDDAQPSFKTFKAGVGWFHVELCAFARKPYAIRYRARIEYLPDDQPPAVSLRVGDAKFVRRADLRVGTDRDYERQLRERVAELGADLQFIQRIDGELEDRIRLPRTDPAAWASWKTATQDRLGEMLERNRLRYAIWAVWPERRGRMSIRGLCFLLERIMVGIEERKEGEDDRKLRERFRDFEEELDEVLTGLRIDVPLNLKKAAPAVAAYEKAVARIRRRPAEARPRREIRADSLEALFNILPAVQSRRRGYVYLNEVAGRLAAVFDRIEAGASAVEVDEALAAHDAALAAFKKFAGIP